MTRPRFAGIDPAARTIWLERLRRVVDTPLPHAALYLGASLALAVGADMVGLVLVLSGFAVTAGLTVFIAMNRAEAAERDRTEALRDATLKAADAMRAAAELMRSIVDQHRPVNIVVGAGGRGTGGGAGGGATTHVGPGGFVTSLAPPAEKPIP